MYGQADIHRSSSTRLPSRPGRPVLPAGSNAVKISASSTIRWVSLLNAKDSFKPRPQGGDRKSGRIEAEAAFLLARIVETPDITLAELQTLLSARRLDVGIGTLWRFFNRRQISLKKKAHAAEQERSDVAAARETWFAAQIDLDPEKLVFIEETGANTKMARLRGRAARGERCRAPVPFGHWNTTNFTAGLRLSGMSAPMLLERFTPSECANYFAAVGYDAT